MRLTKDEIKLVAFLIAAILLGMTIRHYRHRDRLNLPTPPTLVTPVPRAEVDFE